MHNIRFGKRISLCFCFVLRYVSSPLCGQVHIGDTSHPLLHFLYRISSSFSVYQVLTRLPLSSLWLFFIYFCCEWERMWPEVTNCGTWNCDMTKFKSTLSYIMSVTFNCCVIGVYTLLDFNAVCEVHLAPHAATERLSCENQTPQQHM